MPLPIRTSRPPVRPPVRSAAVLAALAGAVSALTGFAPPAAAGAVTTVAPVDPESVRVGALFAGEHHFCTASVLRSPTRDLVITAAHCVAGAAGITFAPGYRDGRAPYGRWAATALYVGDGWRGAHDPDEDFAILRLAPDTDGRQVEDVVGGNPLGPDAEWTATVRLYGYPARTDRPIVCTDSTTRQSEHQRRIDCPAFPGGTSGGPFVEAATGRVIGVIGGYQEGGDTDDISYSAYFDHTVLDLYHRAVADSG